MGGVVRQIGENSLVAPFAARKFSVGSPMFLFGVCFTPHHFHCGWLKNALDLKQLLCAELPKHR